MPEDEKRLPIDHQTLTLPAACVGKTTSALEPVPVENLTGTSCSGCWIRAAGGCGGNATLKDDTQRA